MIICPLIINTIKKIIINKYRNTFKELRFNSAIGEIYSVYKGSFIIYHIIEVH